MTPAQEAAAMHGVALNQMNPTANRLQAALQALEWYEGEVEQLRAQVNRLYRELDSFYGPDGTPTSSLNRD